MCCEREGNRVNSQISGLDSQVGGTFYKGLWMAVDEEMFELQFL